MGELFNQGMTMQLSEVYSPGDSKVREKTYFLVSQFVPKLKFSQ